MNEMNLNNKETITTLEIAEMMETDHKSILRKIEGRTVNGKHIEGVIEILARHHLQPSEFFIKSTYKDASGKKNPCYKCTRKGCEFLAHKFNGEKGIQFTAEYINRFHQMQKAIMESKTLLTTKTVLPPASWYSRNKELIKAVCDVMHETTRDLYAQLSHNLGNFYELSEAEKVYIKETGENPNDIIDIINYFPQLRRKAEEILKRLYYVFSGSQYLDNTLL